MTNAANDGEKSHIIDRAYAANGGKKPHIIEVLVANSWQPLEKRDKSGLFTFDTEEAAQAAVKKLQATGQKRA